MEKLAIFDFDKTILSRDTYEELLLFLVKRSLIRSALTMLAFPVLIAAFNFNWSRLYAINTLSALAFTFQRKSLYQINREFFTYLVQSKKVKYYQEAIKAITHHREHGHEVLILSGCPSWLLRSAIRAGNLGRVTYLGSKQSISHGVLRTTDYCYSNNKVKMAINSGFNRAEWVAGYSDSISDVPFLSGCKAKYVVNPSPSKIGLFSKLLGNGCNFMAWA